MSELVIAEKNDIVNIANEVRRLTGQTEGLNLQEMQTELKSIDNQPDWNQNDPNAKDYIKNRPGGYAIAPSVEITWDGDTTGKETIVVPDNGTLVKIADEAPSIEKFTVGKNYRAIIMAETTYSDGSNETVQKQIDLRYGGDFWMGQLSSPFCMAIGVTVDSINIDGLTFTKGLWFSIADGVEMAKVITCGISTTDGGVKKFPESFIPNEVLSRISDAQDMAQTAQDTANTAKTTADAVKTTADAAKTTADAAMPMTGGNATGEISVVRDTYKCTVGAKKYAVYGFKISYISNGAETEQACFTPQGIFFSEPYKAIISPTEITLGGDYNNQIRLSNDGTNDSNPTSFTMSKKRISDGSASEIVITTDSEIQTTAGDIEIENIGPTYNTRGSGIILKSDTPGSHKKFRISVDDAGTISATEVTT